MVVKPKRGNFNVNFNVKFNVNFNVVLGKYIVHLLVKIKKRDFDSTNHLAVSGIRT